LGHPGLEGPASAGAREEKEHRQYLIAQIGMRLAQGPFALQVEGHIQHCLHFFPAEIQVADQISAFQMSLHRTSTSWSKQSLQLESGRG